MVKTWSDTWFEDQGVRLLYVLPRAWTDQLLPIEITPEPRELVRVMVGRSELITPSREAEIRNCITHFKQTDESRRLEAVRRFQEMGLGRFATPAIRFATRNPQDSELRSSGYELLNAARKLSSSSELARN
jgi:hypothetical protein